MIRMRPCISRARHCSAISVQSPARHECERQDNDQHSDEQPMHGREHPAAVNADQRSSAVGSPPPFDRSRAVAVTSFPLVGSRSSFHSARRQRTAIVPAATANSISSHASTSAAETYQTILLIIIDGMFTKISNSMANLTIGYRACASPPRSAVDTQPSPDRGHMQGIEPRQGWAGPAASREM
jgi:hypothetical protein